jgi:hypothetical protein
MAAFERRWVLRLGGVAVLLALLMVPFYGPVWRYLITLEPQTFEWRVASYASRASLLAFAVGVPFCGWRLWLSVADRLSGRRTVSWGAAALALAVQFACVGAERVERVHWYAAEGAKRRLAPFTLPRAMLFWQTDDRRESWPRDKRVIVLLGSSQLAFAVDARAAETALPGSVLVTRSLPGFSITQYLQVADPLAERGAADVVCWISEFDVFREKRLPVNRLRYLAGGRSTVAMAGLLGPAGCFGQRGELADLATAVVLPQWRDRDTIREVAFDLWWPKLQSVEAMPVSGRDGQRHFNVEQQRANIRASIARTGMVEFNFASFEAFARRLKERGVRLHVFEGHTNIRPLSPELVAYRGEVRTRLQRLAGTIGFEYVSETRMPVFAESDFCDVYHLGEKGRAKFTAFLVERLGPSPATRAGGRADGMPDGMAAAHIPANERVGPAR